ncbi:MAG: ABC transporter permease [Clostridia bacterium]|nr:ABC transporter permease [Clostridia bacterium]MBR5258562.1 ABC transporter permease [Clostridia bacterium]MBR5986857.1 ABC transporter permease [Clostridia bacterium]MBR6008230.1 ABC transporter permease [Clostridia bacterium]
MQAAKDTKRPRRTGIIAAILRIPAVQTILASLMCVLAGLLIGYIVLLFINPQGAGESIINVIKNFFTWKRPQQQLKQFGNTLAKTIPLIMCSLSILFSYKVGLFNIGTAGQYVAGACASLYAALAWGWSWLPCMLFALVAGALLGAIVGALKVYCNVNEVISGIMLNWIALYTTNTILTEVKEKASPYTMYFKDVNNKGALLPNLGLDKLFNNNSYVTIAVPLCLIIAIAITIILSKTRFGYELKATGNNKNAAKYAGMAENRNIILTLMISGALAGLGASMLYQTGYMRWECTMSSVPAMGFNGIAAAFLGGLNPIGAIFSSFFIQHITDGGQYVNTNFYSSQISDVISSIIIYLCGFVLFIKLTMNRAIARSKEKKEAKK